MKIEFENTCYVLLQINQIHPIAHERHKLIWYPERAMTLVDCVNYRPFVKSVVTENPWIISCYSRENVRVWDNGKWVWPDVQTLGKSVNGIIMGLLGIRQTIPSAVYGFDRMEKLVSKLEKTY